MIHPERSADYIQGWDDGQKAAYDRIKFEEKQRIDSLKSKGCVLLQRILGILLLILSLIYYSVCEDGTAVIFTVPLGLYVTFTKRIFIENILR